ncbi:hypothetical protein KKF34_01815 [Myxococcota bacterium]|nr:hypothetical protein [Myxococcota bacterium]MBU1381861.1 hypothetical protein [Myxococcota bacterium]MBU1495596.1 hypothetical protein [Myxococcota bacterium]
MKHFVFLLLLIVLLPLSTSAAPWKTTSLINAQAATNQPVSPSINIPPSPMTPQVVGRVLPSNVPMPSSVTPISPPASAPAQTFSISGVDINVQLEKPAEDIFVGKPFRVLITIVAKPGTKVSFPSAINTGVRFALKKGPDLVSRENLDSGNEKTIYALTLVSFTTDRLMDLKAGRIQKRINDLEMDLTKRKTTLTELSAAGKDTASTAKYITALEQRIKSSNIELAKALEDYNLPPIPLTVTPAGTTEVAILHTHEKGKGPRIIISSKLANDPHPALKEPASEENKKAGGPFWKPYKIYEENTKLKHILMGIGGGLVLFLIIFLIVRKIIRNRREKQPEIPARPANEIALEKLDILRRKGQPEDEEVKEFAYNLSEIIREYFGNRYSFYSLEMTTTELLEKLQEIKPQGVSMEVLEDYLDKLDLVKFAKMQLTPDESGKYLDGGYDIVIVTWSSYMKEIEEAERLAREQEELSDENSAKSTDEMAPNKVSKPAPDPIVPDEDRRWAGLDGKSSTPLREKPDELTKPAGSDAQVAAKTIQDAIPVSGYTFPKINPDKPDEPAQAISDSKVEDLASPTISDSKSEDLPVPTISDSKVEDLPSPTVSDSKSEDLASPTVSDSKDLPTADKVETLSEDDKRWAGLDTSASPKSPEEKISPLDSFHKNLTEKGDGEGGAK